MPGDVFGKFGVAFLQPGAEFLHGAVDKLLVFAVDVIHVYNVLFLDYASG